MTAARQTTTAILLFIDLSSRWIGRLPVYASSAYFAVFMRSPEGAVTDMRCRIPRSASAWSYDEPDPSGTASVFACRGGVSSHAIIRPRSIERLFANDGCHGTGSSAI